jgi:hypothetical protein
LLAVLTLGACALLPTGVPAAPLTTSAPAAPSAVPTPTVTSTPTDPATPSDAGPSRSMPAGVGTDASGRYTYAVPTEPLCALASDVPQSVPGADGPALTLKRVAKAWKASEAGKGWGVSTGTVKASDRSGAIRPGSVLGDPGTGYAHINFFEWFGLQTYVLPDQGRAAGKLAAIRAMMKESCSYPFSDFPDSPSVVATLSEDQPDYLVISGTMAGTPMTDIFIRHGNTVTEFTAAMATLPTEDALSQVRGALANA